MKLKIEAYSKSFTIETSNDDISMGDYIDNFYTLLIGVGFHNDTIVDGFKEFVESKEE